MPTIKSLIERGVAKVSDSYIVMRTIPGGMPVLHAGDNPGGSLDHRSPDEVVISGWVPAVTLVQMHWGHWRVAEEDRQRVVEYLRGHGTNWTDPAAAAPLPDARA